MWIVLGGAHFNLKIITPDAIKCLSTTEIEMFFKKENFQVYLVLLTLRLFGTVSVQSLHRGPGCPGQGLLVVPAGSFEPVSVAICADQFRRNISPQGIPPPSSSFAT